MTRDDDIAAPPHSIETEQALLGAILVNNEAFWEVAETVAAGHFFDPLHGRLYEAMAETIRAGRLATPPLLAARFAAEPAFAFEAPTRTRGEEPERWEVTIPQYLARLFAGAVTVLQAGDYGAHIVDCWRRRRLIEAGQMLALRAADGGRVVGNSVEQAQAEIEVATAVRGRDTMGTGFEAVTAAIEKDTARPLTWGLAALDADTGGLRRGEYYVAAGRPSMGKSVFATSMARAQAVAGQGVLLFSLEMGRRIVGARLLSDAHFSHGRVAVAFHAILADRVPGADWAGLTATAQAFEVLPLAVDTGSGLTVHDLKARARRLKRAWVARGRSLDTVIVDYMGLLRPGPSYAGNKAAETEEISLALKELAKELDVALVVLVQLNREVESRPDKRPTLSDLRWSGAIEQDADIVLMLYRESYYLERQKAASVDEQYERDEKLRGCRNVLELIIAKQRNGPCRTIEAWVDMAASAIRDAADPGMGGMAA